MLNIIATDKVPAFEHEELMDQFLMNVVAFSVAVVTKDYSTFDPRVVAMVEEDPEWLPETADWGQAVVVGSLLDGDNYETVEDVVREFEILLNLYKSASRGELSQEKENMFISLHDKFLALLLTDDELINKLIKMLEGAEV